MNNRKTYFLSDRNRNYCLSVTEDPEKGVKEISALFPESAFHLSSLLRHRRLFDTLGLKAPELLDMEEEKLTFELIRGRSLLDEYKKILDNGSREELIGLLKKHRTLSLGSDDCACEFEARGDFEKFFKDGSAFEGKPARDPANFSAFAECIVFKDQEPYFTDCEWAFNFPVPEDLIVLQWLARLYEELPELADMVDITEAKELLIADPENAEKALALYYDEICGDEEESDRELCMFLKYKDSKSIDRIARENVFKDKLIFDLGLQRDFMEKNWKSACEMAEQLKIDHKKDLKKLKDEMQEEVWDMQRQRDHLQQFQDQVLSSRAWKLTSKAKKMLGRG